MQPNEIALTWSHHPVEHGATVLNMELLPFGLTTCRDRQRQAKARTDSRHHRLALGTWNITYLVGEEPELVWEVVRYQLDILGFTSMHSSGSGTKL